LYSRVRIGPDVLKRMLQRDGVHWRTAENGGLEAIFYVRATTKKEALQLVDAMDEVIGEITQAATNLEVFIENHTFKGETA